MSDNPWMCLPNRPPFVLPKDEEFVEQFNKRASEKHRLHIDEILPEPFVGDPLAPVVLLGNNPGYSPEGVARKKDPRFATRMRDNLLHKPSDCPFVFFATDVDAGHRPWWEKKLKGLLSLGHQTLAKRIFAVEHFPYPSRRYKGGKVRLPSGAQEYSFGLVKSAMERKAIVVLMHGSRRWLRAVPDLEDYEGLCLIQNPQSASVSLGNCERFEEVRRAVEGVSAPTKSL